MESADFTKLSIDDNEKFSRNIDNLTDNKISIDSIIFDLNNDHNHMPQSRKFNKLENLKHLIATNNRIIAETLTLNVSDDLLQSQLSPLMMYMHDVMQFTIFKEASKDVKLYKFDVTFGPSNNPRQIVTYAIATSIEEANDMVLDRYENPREVFGEMIVAVSKELPSSSAVDLLIDN